MPNDLEINFLDVGQGDGTLVQCSDGSAILIDMGSKKNADVAGGDAITFVKRRLIELQNEYKRPHPTLDKLFITHGDGDHYNLIPNLIDAFPTPPNPGSLNIGEVLIGGPMGDYNDVIKQKLLLPANDLHILRTFNDAAHDAAGSPAWKFANGDVELYLLSANYPTIHGLKNGKSICLMFAYMGRKIILMGDAEGDTEAFIMTKFSSAFLASDVLKLGHHGSKAGSTTNWLAAVAPRFVVASSDMKWAHPYCEVVQRVSDNKSTWAVIEHPWLCGMGSGVTKDYRNHWNDCGIYTTLMLQKQNDDVEMQASEKALNQQLVLEYDPNGVLPNGTVQGTQWAIAVLPKGVNQNKGDMAVAYIGIDGNAIESPRFNTKPIAACPSAAGDDMLLDGPIVLDDVRLALVPARG